MSGAVSPEELRQQIINAISDEWSQTVSIRYIARAADSVIAVLSPTIRRALARDAAIEAEEYMHNEAPQHPDRPIWVDSHNALLRRLRAVGGEQ